MDRGGLTGTALATLAGDAAALDESGDGVPRITPRTPAGVARLLREASIRGWRTRVEHDAWSPTDAPADFALSTRGLDDVRNVSRADQVATAGAGVTLGALTTTPWFAVDPPGHDRTLGSLLATATAGPLVAGYGGVRDQVLGLTAITGDGRTVTAGGRVMKNVAGYDLAKLFIGGFDAFGVIVSAHVRLRATPRMDQTAMRVGTRDKLLDLAWRLLERGLQPASLVLLRHDDTWTLAVRLHAPTPVLDHAGWQAAEPAWWPERFAPADAPVSLRLGTVPDGVGRALDLIERHLPPGLHLSASVVPGLVRWCGAATPEALRGLRDEAARHEMPLTLERAPWPVRETLGVHGAYREGVHPLVQTLRRAFDPAGALVV